MSLPRTQVSRSVVRPALQLALQSARAWPVLLWPVLLWALLGSAQRALQLGQPPPSSSRLVRREQLRRRLWQDATSRTSSPILEVALEVASELVRLSLPHPSPQRRGMAPTMALKSEGLAAEVANAASSKWE